MRSRRILLLLTLTAVLPIRTGAAQTKPPSNSAVHASEKPGTAESVFASSASKIVFLITRKSGELYARASGIILTTDGYIATNYHALQGADAVEIRFFPNPESSEDYRSFNGAKLFYADAERDIAVLKVNARSLPFLDCPVKTGCVARIGEKVYAIGNPMGLTNTISEGIVSAFRSAGSEDIIQHTAAISHGSSGGALVDSNGALLGMNSWQMGDAQSINFAISAKHLVEAREAAAHATMTLSFPHEGPVVEEASATEAKAWQAYQSRDYIQAANQAEQVVASGGSNSKIYMILGRADTALGKKEEAERYLRQALQLSGPDDNFKQTARLYLLQILGDRYVANPASVDRLDFFRLATDFLASGTGTVEDPDLYRKVRAWAATVPPNLRSIEDLWTDTSSASIGRCSGWIRIFAAENGGFSLFGSKVSRELTCDIKGMLAPSEDGFSGELIRSVAMVTRSGAGVAEQTLSISLHLSADLMTIEGTTAGGKITIRGKEGKAAANFLDAAAGPNGPWHFTLHRAK